MTPKLRELIKENDNYTCRICQNSIEMNLFIIRNGSYYSFIEGWHDGRENLQTLCGNVIEEKVQKFFKLKTILIIVINLIFKFIISINLHGYTFLYLVLIYFNKRRNSIKSLKLDNNITT